MYTCCTSETLLREMPAFQILIPGLTHADSLTTFIKSVQNIHVGNECIVHSEQYSLFTKQRTSP